MENLKKALAEEAPFKLSEEVMDKFCSIMEEKRLKKREVMIQCGELNDNIYVVKEGILRRSHMDGDKYPLSRHRYYHSILHTESSPLFF